MLLSSDSLIVYINVHYASIKYKRMHKYPVCTKHRINGILHRYQSSYVSNILLADYVFHPLPITTTKLLRIFKALKLQRENTDKKLHLSPRKQETMKMQWPLELYIELETKHAYKITHPLPVYALITIYHLFICSYICLYCNKQGITVCD